MGQEPASALPCGSPGFLQEQLVCPRDHLPLRQAVDTLQCPAGHSYAVIDGIPILLLEEAEATHWIGRETLRLGADTAVRYGGGPGAQPEGVAPDSEVVVHPFVRQWVRKTCGNMYGSLVGALSEYPIPELPLPDGCGATLLDVGSNWGRWTIAAARRGYRAVGVDPSLPGIAAGRFAARQLSVDAAFLVADGRFLPFPDGSFDLVFSYSVLQHLSWQNAELVLREIARVLRPGGLSMVQMANAYGVRSAYHQARRRFREARAFEVRFWPPRRLLHSFEATIGTTEILADCYFGLGIRWSDRRIYLPRYRPLAAASEMLRRASRWIPGLRFAADSIWLQSRRNR